MYLAPTKSDYNITINLTLANLSELRVNCPIDHRAVSTRLTNGRVGGNKEADVWSVSCRVDRFNIGAHKSRGRDLGRTRPRGCSWTHTLMGEYIVRHGGFLLQLTFFAFHFRI